VAEINKQMEDDFVALGEIMQELIEKYKTGYSTSITAFDKHHISIGFQDGKGFFKIDNNVSRNY